MKLPLKTAFGSRLQNIITTDEKTAKGAIDILIKKKRPEEQHLSHFHP